MKRPYLCALTAGAAFLSACSAPEIYRRHDPDVEAMEAPLVMGLEQIREKALAAPDMKHVFATGMAGFTSIDKFLSYEIDDREMKIRRGPIIVSRLRRSLANDISRDVADLQALLADARAASPVLGITSSETMLQSFFNGAVSALDGYSHYASRIHAERDRMARNGVIGVGLELEAIPDGAVVMAVQKNTPAEGAGIKVGDIIVRAEGRSLAGLSLASIRKHLDGPIDMPLTITVARKDAKQNYTIRRKLIIAEPVKAEALGSVLHLKLKTFNQRTTMAVAEAIAASENPRGIILDMRSDPGGLLDQAIEVADLFLDQGTIIRLHGRHPSATQFYAARPGSIATGVPMIILVDGMSASAAEIVAAALQENGRAAVIGTASVGKGTVQSLISLANGGELSLTWARATTPSGSMLDERGILPDICTTSPPLRGQVSVGEVISTLIKVRAGTKSGSSIQDVKAARAACRPEPRRDQALDTELARQILTDPNLAMAFRLPLSGQTALSH